MRCPNCHSVVGNNVGICQYCGYDIGQFLRQNQAGAEPTYYPARDIYENTEDYYRKAYEWEKRRNEKYRNSILYVILGGLLSINLIELAVLVVMNL